MCVCVCVCVAAGVQPLNMGVARLFCMSFEWNSMEVENVAATRTVSFIYLARHLSGCLFSS